MNINIALDNHYQERVLYVDNELMINNYPVLQINHNIDINDNNIDLIIKDIDYCMNNLDNNKLYILLFNFDEMDHNVSIIRLKKIIKHAEINYMYLLHKCIIYNYTNSWKMILDIVLTFLCKSTKEKICLRQNININ